MKKNLFKTSFLFIILIIGILFFILLIQKNNNKTQWYGKKHVTLGTSMTVLPESYSRKVSKSLGMKHDNRGHSGGGITSSAYSGDTTMQEALKIEDFNGLLTVEIGPNDGNHPLGELGDTTNDTFYGALYNLLDTLQRRTSARIVILTMTGDWAEKVDSGRGERKTVFQNFGIESGSLWKFKMNKAIKETAFMFSIPVIDILAESGLGGYNLNSQTSKDWIHHTELGGQIVADYVVHKLISLNPFPDELKPYEEN